jgi:hypothetical protein
MTVPRRMEIGGTIAFSFGMEAAASLVMYAASTDIKALNPARIPTT